MSNTLPPGYVLPSPGIPKLVGLLNVIFGSLLILVGLGYIGFYLIMPSYYKLSEAAEKARVDSLRDQRTAQIAELKKQEELATVKEAREELRLKRKILEATPVPQRASLGPRASFDAASKVDDGFVWTETIAGLILNAAMVIAGAGLMALWGWARRLALWVAALKIARLGIMSAVTLFVLVPNTSAALRRDMIQDSGPFENAAAEAQARKEANETAQFWAYTESAASVGLLLLGSIYPVVVIVLLNRRGARAAFIAAARRAGPVMVGPGVARGQVPK
jgi:hypothetical protein